MIAFLGDFPVEHAEGADTAPIPRHAGRVLGRDLIASKSHPFDVKLPKILDQALVSFAVEAPELGIVCEDDAS